MRLEYRGQRLRNGIKDTAGFRYTTESLVFICETTVGTLFFFYSMKQKNYPLGDNPEISSLVEVDPLILQHKKKKVNLWKGE